MTLQNEPKTNTKANIHPTRHAPDIEVVKFCTQAYIADMKGIYSELERVNERIETLSEPLKGIDYSKMLGISSSCKGERLTDLIDALESLEQSITSIEQEFNYFTALLDTLEFGEYIFQHYFYGLSWNVIALREQVTRMAIWKRKEQTLRDLYSIMPEQYRRFTIPNAIV